MLINGKEVEINFKKAAEIQTKVNQISQLPDNAKTEVSKKDLKALETVAENFYNNYDGYGITNNTLLTGKKSKENRRDYYATFQEMSEYNFIHRGLTVISDDCSQKGVDGHVMKNLSDDDEIKQILDSLFFDRLNIDKELWSIFYETCKLGDNFYEVIPDSYKNPTMIARIRYLEPDRVNRIEKNGKLAFYTYTADALDPEESIFMDPNTASSKKDEDRVIYKLEPWQIIHFRITDKDFYPYGGSLLKSGVKCFRHLQLLEDGMVIYRLARVPERRVFKIGCGNLPQSEANRYVKNIANNYRGTQILDDHGNINRTASALSLNQDIFIPVREGDTGTEISTLSPGVALQNIDDIRYFRDQILWTMNIPPERLGSTSDQSGSEGRGSLAMKDIQFSRFAERIQYHISEGLTKIAAIELFFKHKKKSDLNNFKIELTPPSNIKELMDIEYLNSKMQLIQTMNGTGMFPKKFILQYVMKLSKKEINNLMFFKDLEAQASQAQENTLIGSMGGAGMMGGDMSGGSMSGGDMSGGSIPAGDTSGASAPAASINTENLEDNLVKIFGKDILIEHKEDFVKLVKAANEYNEKIIEEENDDTTSDFMKTLTETIVKEDTIKTNKESTSLLFENELGGLDYDKNTFSTFEAPKKKTGPKSKGLGYLYEEKTVHFDY